MNAAADRFLSKGKKASLKQKEEAPLTNIN